MEFVSVRMPDSPTAQTQPNNSLHDSSPPVNDEESAFSPNTDNSISSNRAESWKSFASSSSTLLAELSSTLFTRAADTYASAQTQLTKRMGVIAKLAGIAGFAIACVALWSTLSAMGDSGKALALAEWTARKDFLEFCQASNYSTTECQKEKETPLDPPPKFTDRDSESNNDYRGIVCGLDIQGYAGLPIFRLPSRDQFQIGENLQGVPEFGWRPPKTLGSESPGQVLKLWQYFGRLMGTIRDTDEL
ncbi:hypothetical protein C8A01DRAFT_38384 [Parachaetomium inaequale]|uniref:Uncharacterized protein n=1 Tax=Parachaetomium inaequale TaxID=2588326 RepID=A0AAN6SPM8_9PEZI|nr:hypothetical protein C8A01DRAFT_38384 [Parachaetomium inaequale]